MKINRLLLALLCCTAFFSCSDNNNDDVTPVACGTYVLNNGNWGGNDANVGIYDPAAKTYVPDAFYAANGQKLGDLGQDIIRFGSDVYIAVNGSQTIFVTDPDLKIKHQVNADNEGTPLSPREFATNGDKVYVTYYEGFAGEINPADYSVKLCAVGPNPDGCAAAAGNLYIAASGGMSYPDYNNTVSVISLKDFTHASSIEVSVNPAKVEASSDGAYVYVSSFGNYADVLAKLQVIETVSGKVTDLEYPSVSSVAKGKDDVLYILCGGYDENWNPLPGTVYRHDMKTNKPLGPFISDDVTLSNAYSISVADDGYVYVGCSDYVTTGDVYVMTPEGKLHDKFDSQGFNPQKVY